MTPRLRRSLTSTLADHTKAELFARSQGTTLEDFWDAAADETEKMSNEDLRAELASLRIWSVRDFH